MEQVQHQQQQVNQQDQNHKKEKSQVLNKDFLNIKHLDTHIKQLKVLVKSEEH